MAVLINIEKRKHLEQPRKDLSVYLYTETLGLQVFNSSAQIDLKQI